MKKILLSLVIVLSLTGIAIASGWMDVGFFNQGMGEGGAPPAAPVIHMGDGTTELHQGDGVTAINMGS